MPPRCFRGCVSDGTGKALKINGSTSARIVASMTALVPALAGDARAADAQEAKRVCADAANLGQELRDQGRYQEAQDLLVTCSAATCPPLVEENCVRWLNELRTVMPQIVVGAQDASGRDLTDVNVFIDGVPFERALDGSPRAADPGPHTLRFEAANHVPIEERIVLRSGEKNRVIVVKFPPAPLGNENAPAPLGVRTSPVETESPEGSERPRPAATSPEPHTPPPHAAGIGEQRILGITAGAAGIAGIAAASVFGALSLSASNAQKSECFSLADCNNRTQAISDHANAVTDATISTVGFIAGGALVVAGLLLFVTSRGPLARPAGLLVTPSVGLGGGWITLQASF